MRRRHYHKRKRRKRWSRSGYPGLRHNVPYPNRSPDFYVKDNILNWRLMYKSRKYIKSNLPILNTFKECKKIKEFINSEDVNKAPPMYRKIVKLVEKYDPVFQLYHVFEGRRRENVTTGVNISKVLERARDTYISGKAIGLLSDEQVLPNLKSFEQGAEPVNYYYPNAPDLANLHVGSISDKERQAMANMVVDTLENRFNFKTENQKIFSGIEASSKSFTDFIKEYTVSQTAFGEFSTKVLADIKSLIHVDVKASDIKKAYKDAKPTKDEELMSLLNGIKDAISKINVRFDDNFTKIAGEEIMDIVRQSNISINSIAAALKKRDTDTSGGLEKLSTDVQGVKGGVDALIQEMKTNNTYDEEAKSRYESILDVVTEIKTILSNQQHEQPPKPFSFSLEKKKSTTHDTNIKNTLKGIIKSIASKSDQKQKEYTDLIDDFLGQLTGHVQGKNETIKRFIQFVFDKNKEYRESVIESNKKIIDTLKSNFEDMDESIMKTNKMMRSKEKLTDVEKFLIDMNSGLRSLPNYLNAIKESMNDYVKLNVLGQDIMDDTLKKEGLDLYDVIRFKIHVIAPQCSKNVNQIQTLLTKFFNAGQKEDVTETMVKLSYIVDKVLNAYKEMEIIRYHRFVYDNFSILNNIGTIIEHLDFIKKTNNIYEIRASYERNDLLKEEEERHIKDRAKISEILQEGKKRKQPSDYPPGGEGVVGNIRNMATNIFGGVVSTAAGFVNFYNNFGKPDKEIYENIEISPEDDTYVEEDLEYPSMDVEPELSRFDIEPESIDINIQPSGGPPNIMEGPLNLDFNNLLRLFKYINIAVDKRNITRTDSESKIHNELTVISNEYTSNKIQNMIKKMSKDIGFFKKIIACGYLTRERLIDNLIVNLIKTIICNVSVTKEDLERQTLFMEGIEYNMKSYDKHFNDTLKSYYLSMACVLSERIRGKTSFKAVIDAFYWAGYRTLNSNDFGKGYMETVMDTFKLELDNSIEYFQGQKYINLKLVIGRASKFRDFLVRIRQDVEDAKIARPQKEKYSSFITNMDKKKDFKEAMIKLENELKGLVVGGERDMFMSEVGDKIVLPEGYPKIFLLTSLCSYAIINLDDLRRKDEKIFKKIEGRVGYNILPNEYAKKVDLDKEINRKKIHLDYLMCKHIYTLFHGREDGEVIDKVVSVMQNIFIV